MNDEVLIWRKSLSDFVYYMESYLYGIPAVVEWGDDAIEDGIIDEDTRERIFNETGFLETLEASFVTLQEVYESLDSQFYTDHDDDQ